MAITRRNRAYFTTVTSPGAGVPGDRFVANDEPTSAEFVELFNSVAFMNESDDAASTTQQGLVRLATNAQVIAGDDSADANGFIPVVSPSQVGLLGSGFTKVAIDVSAPTFLVTGGAAVDSNSYQFASSYMNVYYNLTLKLMFVEFKLHCQIDPNNSIPGIWLVSFQSFDTGNTSLNPVNFSTGYWVSCHQQNVTTAFPFDDKDVCLGSIYPGASAGQFGIQIAGSGDRYNDMLRGNTTNQTLIYEGVLSCRTD